MNRLSLLGFFGFGLVSVALVGCPVFDDGGQWNGCPNGEVNCGSGGSQGVGGGKLCSAPTDCGPSETCAKDSNCHTGDCTYWGCVSGFSCEIDKNGFPSCQPGGSGGSGGSGGTGGASSGGGGTGGSPDVTWCGHPADCVEGLTCAPDGTCQVGDCAATGCIFGYTCNAASGICEGGSNACGGDADCADKGANFECVNGQCTAPSDQCFDQNQCSGGKKCAGGKCETACTGDTDCTSSFKCDIARGVCVDPAITCHVTNNCGSLGHRVCVDGGCVPRSNGGDCPDGTAWVENGCVPSQAPTVSCAIDGTQDACADGSICLHHSCYVACASDASICNGLPTLNQCQNITSSSGTYKVCGASDSVGSDCDPTQGLECSTGKICIDGVCK